MGSYELNYEKIFKIKQSFIVKTINKGSLRQHH